jgi:hypothetical protein
MNSEIPESLTDDCEYMKALIHALQFVRLWQEMETCSNHLKHNMGRAITSLCTSGNSGKEGILTIGLSELETRGHSHP